MGLTAQVIMSELNVSIIIIIIMLYFDAYKPRSVSNNW